MEIVMAGSARLPGCRRHVPAVPLVAILALLAAVPRAGHAQVPPQAQMFPETRLVVIGEGSVSVTPDLAQVRCGVTSRGKTVQEAVQTNARTMAAVNAAVTESGVPPKDIQTTRFSVQPIYTPAQPGAEPTLTGYSVSNQVTVKIRQIDIVGQVIDRLVMAGANDVGNVEFLFSDQSRALDQAREIAMADARRKADVYARASGVLVGHVVWIAEELTVPPVVTMRSASAPAGPTPITAGDDTLRTRVTVGFDFGR
jgi:uncharacterized protein YggE